MLQRQFYFFGTYFLEEDALCSWESAARDANVIFDVGANAGIYGLAALAIQPCASVHAFEPTPEIAVRLRETAKVNGLDHLYVHEVAVSNDNGRAILKRCRGELGTNGEDDVVDSGARDVADGRHVGDIELRPAEFPVAGARLVEGKPLDRRSQLW